MLLKLFITLIGLLLVQPVLSQQDKKDHEVSGIGFRTTRMTGKDGNPLVISTWYPSKQFVSKMTLRDYLIAGKLTSDLPDSDNINQFKNILERPLFGHPVNVTGPEFDKLLSVSFKANRDAPMQQGKFPLVIATAKPDSYIETFEFLASHGFVVAAITTKWKDEANDTLLYVNATNVLAELLRFAVRQPYIDTNNISAFGHGGGIQPAFYLAMRTSTIKLLVNLDGGVFGLRSKTTLSPDYNASSLKIPMLHIITQSQRKMDDAAEFNALSNVRYRLTVKSDAVRHHDFTMWGRVTANNLHQRGNTTALVNEVFASTDQLILYFLKNKRLNSSAVPANLFQYEKF